MSAVESGRKRGELFVRIRGQRWGAEVSPIVHGARDYMHRFIAYANGYTARLHHIMTNDTRGPAGLHNHPFWFVTFPFGDYIEEYWERCEHWHVDGCPQGPLTNEQYYALALDVRHEYNMARLCKGGVIRTRTVRGWRFHFRPRNFRHRIIELPNGPVWTFCISGRYEQQWGFFPDGTDASFYPFRPKQGTTHHADPNAYVDSARR